MGKNLFSECKALKSIECNSSTGEASFKDLEALESVVLGAQTKTIGKQSFSGCKKIRELNLPVGLETIEEQAFYGCEGLTKVVLPETLKTLEQDIFYGTNALKTMIFEGAHAAWNKVEKNKDWSKGAGVTYPTKIEAPDKTES